MSDRTSVPASTAPASTAPASTAPASTAPASTAPASTGAAGKSTGELVHQAAEQLSRLVRDEIKLAQAELTRKARAMGKGAGLLGGSSVLAFYGTGCLLAAAVAGLALVLPIWAAALIAGGAVLALAGLAALVGKHELSQSTPLMPEQALQSTRADVETIVERARQ
jgi:Putative Actinobacterial Holin-X, holin superfamily III